MISTATRGAAVPLKMNLGQRRVSTTVKNGWVKVGIFFALHIPLGLLMFMSPVTATVHAVVTPIAGTIWLLSNRKLERAAYVAAYIMGSEVLWRMTDAMVPWEFGKYSISGILLIALFGSGRAKWPKLPILYFALLLPGIYLAVETLGVYARKGLSFNLSGPLALMVCVCFFSNLKMTADQLYRFFLAYMGPVVGIASITAMTTFSMEAITRADVAGNITSAGFGANQVSAVLGMGVLFAILILLDKKHSLAFRFLIFAAMVLLGVQSALTFSRGGLYMAAAGAVLASFYLVRKKGMRIRLVTVIGGILLLTSFVVLPYLDAFTQGSLSSRFMDTSSTGRDRIVLIDLQIWKENPIFGVGPGVARIYRHQVYKALAAHTEYSRLVAEHGVLGLAALLLLVVMAVQAIRRAKGALGKAVSAAMLGWCFIFLLVDGMRLAVASVAFGLSFVTLFSNRDAQLMFLRSVFRGRALANNFAAQSRRGYARVIGDRRVAGRHV